MNITLRLANYISRYAPSLSKLMTYLEKKNCQNPDELLMQHGYSESMMCDMWMRSYVALGKGQQDMKMRLMKKSFPKDMIEEKLESFSIEIRDWDANSSAIQNQIDKLVSRGKSKRIISSLLMSQYPYFRDEITELFSGTDDGNNLTKEVQKYKNRYTVIDKKIREKMIASLLRKGFSYTDIKNELNQSEDDAL